MGKLTIDEAGAYIRDLLSLEPGELRGVTLGEAIGLCGDLVGEEADLLGGFSDAEKQEVL